mmetsp:Transcript_67207/g.161023  ORF Transcript_67207/g.161023 Transcript_67207/m.161023 type:complete len:531 (+) Transcript_67207:65-1657(+)
MFGVPDFFDIGHTEATKVFVRRNGTGGPLKEVVLPPHSKLTDLFEKASKVLDLHEAPQRAFYTNGMECTDIDHIGRDEVIHISCGEPFKMGDVKESSRQVVGNYILHEKLGQGGFGSVMKGVHAETGEPAAVKFVPKKSFRQISDLHRVFQEIQALRNLRHPNVIRILDVADHPESICFIMEFAAGGELRGYVEKQGLLHEEEARNFFKQIVRAVHYIHSKKIIHRDLKLENILLDAKKVCKIVDFGLSDYVSSKERTVTDAGTEAYLAPEVWGRESGQSDPYKLDIWSLGVILYAMTHGKLPFRRPDVETVAMLEKDGVEITETLTSGCIRLLKGMMTPNPRKRVSIHDVTLDTWVTANRFAHNHDGEDSEEEPDVDDEDPPEDGDVEEIRIPDEEEEEEPDEIEQPAEEVLEADTNGDPPAREPVQDTVTVPDKVVTGAPRLAHDGPRERSASGQPNHSRLEQYSSPRDRAGRRAEQRKVTEPPLRRSQPAERERIERSWHRAATAKPESAVGGRVRSSGRPRGSDIS